MEKYKTIYNKLENFKITGLTKTVISKLNKLDIYCLYDLFYYFPRGYENSAVLCNIDEIHSDNQAVILKGKIVNITKKYISGSKLMITAIFDDGTDTIELIWFNNRFVFGNIPKLENIIISGKVKFGYKKQIINPMYKREENISEIKTTVELEPKYSLTSGLKQEKLRQIIKQAINKYGNLLKENMPIDFVYNNKIMSRNQAIMNVHFPRNSQALELAIRRFTYEEIMILEMGILKNKFFATNNNINKYSLENKKSLVKKYIESLPYELTKAQKKVIAQIHNELVNGKIVSRLIQGDVGSGKTIVSFILMLYMVENGYQSAMMAPTEILAKQHYDTIVKTMKNIDVNICFLSSSVKAKEKKSIVDKIKNEEIDIVIGTHSIIQDNVEFKKLALCVIDEQHKFGVEQRNNLRQKSTIPNLIVMSATPIPRSLALTIYGDLDVSVINELPQGRKPVITKWIKNEIDKQKMYDFINKKILEKEQVYIVAPLIEQSEKLNLISVKETYQEIEKYFPNYRIEILHGKQKNEEKDKIMQNFKSGMIDILISTTVVEVGVDVPDANIMLIKNAEKFGLSTLHQLRGRVGRSSKKGYCFLESYTTKELSEKRLSILEKENDGFKIANEDLKLRNTGQIYGVKQSGVSDLVFLDIIKNINEIEAVKNFVHKYLEEHNGNIENDYLKYDIQMKEKNK